jgi:hypothetical protein
MDDWDGDLARVKDAEIVVREYSEQHYREYHKSSLRQLVDSGFEMDKHLGNIHQDLREEVRYFLINASLTSIHAFVGQLVSYMREHSLKYGFLTTYSTTIERLESA